MTRATERANCTFESCDPSIIERVVVAAVDQLCAEGDIDIALLDALEHPLSESLAALAPYDITRVDIEVDGSDLRIDVHVGSDVVEPLAALGDAAEVVLSFFELGPLDSDRRLSLVGSVA